MGAKTGLHITALDLAAGSTGHNGRTESLCWCTAIVPASTQDTGKDVLAWAGSRTVVFRIRFCLAPWSSSPSSRRMGLSELFVASNSGTLPDSLTSVTVSNPASIASLGQ